MDHLQTRMVYSHNLPQLCQHGCYNNNYIPAHYNWNNSNIKLNMKEPFIMYGLHIATTLAQLQWWYNNNKWNHNNSNITLIKGTIYRPGWCTATTYLNDPQNGWYNNNFIYNHYNWNKSSIRLNTKKSFTLDGQNLNYREFHEKGTLSYLCALGIDR